MENKGFTVYPNYWEAIKFLPEETQGKVCLALVKYGITNEMPDAAENPFGFALVQSWKISIDNSINNHMNAGTKGSKGGRKPLTNYAMIGEMREQGKSAKEIAESLGVSVDTIYKRQEWRDAKPEPKENNGAKFNF